jgi:hypothetical protein
MKATMKTMIALALAAALGGCVVLPDQHHYRGDRYSYGERYDRDFYGERRAIPYRDDGYYGGRHWRDDDRGDDYGRRGRFDHDD